jgi:YVTN family beta-propeller protein
MSSLLRFAFPRRLRFPIAAVIGISSAVACSDSTSPFAPGFLGGTGDSREIGIVVNSTGKAVTLFQIGSPSTQAHIALGTSSAVTPTGFSIAGRRIAVPLGNAASVALINLETDSITRFYQFASGNATGSAFLDDTTIIAANTSAHVLGRMTIGQASDGITSTIAVCNDPTAVTTANGRIFATCSNLDANFAPAGNGIVTIVDAKTFTVLGNVTTGGTNSTDAAVGPDGLLYVVNTGDFVAPGSVSVIDPVSRQVVTTITVGIAPGAISIDKNGLAYISSFSEGTFVLNTKTRAFVRGPDNPVCAKVASTGKCRGAFATTTGSDGSVYQLFFGSASQGLAPAAFIYAPTSFALRDSVSVGAGPAAIQVRTF